MTRRSIILVSCGVLAVLVGLAVAFIGRSDSSTASATTTPVLVANDRISSGTNGTSASGSGLVVVRQVEVADRQLGALTDPAQLAGRTFSTEVASGEQVMLTDLEAPALRDAAIEVPAGTEAVAIEVPFVPGGAGYASPGDAVNVFALLDSVDLGTVAGEAPAAPADPSTATVSVLTNVVVLDVSVEVAPRVAARSDAIAATSTSTTAPASSVPPSQVTYLLAVPVADVPDLVQAAGFHRLYVSIPAKGTPPRPASVTDDAGLVGAGR